MWLTGSWSGGFVTVLGGFTVMRGSRNIITSRNDVSGEHGIFTPSVHSIFHSSFHTVLRTVYVVVQSHFECSEWV